MRAVLEIARRRGAELIVKGKSMVSEEIELNPALEAAGITPVETDLGEWIVQLAGERPSHILAPVIHRSRGQIAEVLAAHSGSPMADDPQGLVTYSREQLRASFLEAGMGITGANFMVAESGTVDRARERGQRPARLVAPALPRRARRHGAHPGDDRRRRLHGRAALTRGRRPQLPSYVSWLSGPAADGDDGPDEFVVIVLDNGRSRVRESDEREILNCIRCGSCLTVCPVYSKVGGHAYGSVYGGPIGAVLTPLLTDMRPDEGRKLPFLSSLCGACTDICPVGIPLHDLLVRDRALANRAGVASRGERAAWGAWARAWSSPRLYRASARAGARSGPLARAFGPGASWLQGRATLPLPEHEAVPPALARSRGRAVIDAFIAALGRDGSSQGVHVPDSAAAREHIAALLGRDATLCFWSGDPLVMALDPAVARPRGSGVRGRRRDHRRSVRRRGDGHARPDLRRGQARARPACCPICTSRCWRSTGSFPTLDEAIAGVYAGDVPRAMTLVTGASATSDIEKIRVTGAHGPRRVPSSSSADRLRDRGRSSSAIVSRRVSSCAAPSSTSTAARRGMAL